MDLLPSEEAAIETLKKTARYFNVVKPPYEAQDFQLPKLVKAKCVIVMIFDEEV